MITLLLQVQTPFCTQPLTDEVKDYNRSTSAVRVSVEWLFGQITTYFKFVDFKRNLCLGLSPIGKLYTVAALLDNALTYCHGNIASDAFDIMPPSLEEYFVITEKKLADLTKFSVLM